MNTLVRDDLQGYDAATCYSANTSTYTCPLGSHVYQYRKMGKGYTLSSDFEFKICDNSINDLCISDNSCLDGALCVAPWAGKITPISPSEPDPSMV